MPIQRHHGRYRRLVWARGASRVSFFSVSGGPARGSSAAREPVSAYLAEPAAVTAAVTAAGTAAGRRICEAASSDQRRAGGPGRRSEGASFQLGRTWAKRRGGRSPHTPLARAFRSSGGQTRKGSPDLASGGALSEFCPRRPGESRLVAPRGDLGRFWGGQTVRGPSAMVCGAGVDPSASCTLAHGRER